MAPKFDFSNSEIYGYVDSYGKVQRIICDHEVAGRFANESFR